MNDLKQISRSKGELRSLIRIQTNFRRRHEMGFVLEKCKKHFLKNGKIQRRANVANKLEIEIEILESRKAYKYSRVDKNHITEYKDGKSKLKKEYLRRMRPILYTELSSESKWKHFTRSAASAGI
jgi:hypothetical protein